MTSGWWQVANGAYLNPDHVVSVWIIQDGSDWFLEAAQGPGEVPGTEVSRLKGVYTSEADAQTVMDRLVRGFDPSTLL